MTTEHDTEVSAKIPEKLKQELESPGISMSATVRNGFENVLKDRKIKSFKSYSEMLALVD